MNKKFNQIISIFNRELGLILSISFGVFLFILFFEPFPIERFDYNNRLLYIAGLGAIVFLFVTIVRVLTPTYDSESYFASYIKGFLLISLSCVAFAFYLRYVGGVGITFYIMFKVILICMSPSLALKLYDTIKRLQMQNAELISEKKKIQGQVEKYEEDYLNKTIEFISENSSENLSLQIADVVLIKSADNYVEIVFKEADVVKKKLIRNTLKNVELQIRQYSNFIRCHRVCIVNMHYVEKLHSSYNTHSLIIKGYDEQIPVSRQYLLKLKELL